MRIFDAHIRSDTRTDDELRNLHYFETERAVTAAHAPRRFETAADLLAYFDALLGPEVERLRRCDLIPHVALGVLPDARPRRAHYEVWRELPELLRRDPVVAVGEIAAWEDTRTQWELFERQVKLALEADLPIMVTPPAVLHVNMTYKMMRRIDQLGFPASRCLLLRVRDRVAHTAHTEGFVVGIAVGNENVAPRDAARFIVELAEERGALQRVALCSSLRRGAADVLGVPKTIVALRDLGCDDELLQMVAHDAAAKLLLPPSTTT